MTVLWSRRALRGLDAIAEYIGQRDPGNVGRVVARISATVLRYSRFPHLGRASSQSGIREAVVPGLPHVIHYQVRDDVFLVVHIRHTAQRAPM